ncbi:MAG: GDSL-type esterase/lipase family protein [Candidatus Omnitrophica bacterium]|nr:GDSL-type esterase/lipase family protein [Candidatus Omnitrophota bacterium]
MKKISGKFFTVLAGIGLSLVVLEAVLRIIGLIHLSAIRPGIFKNGNTSDYVILCLGDSFSEGIGAAPDKSYPSQLRELIANNFQGMPVKVVNMGMGAYNSSMLLDKFSECVYRVKPDLVIILAGSANIWSSLGYMRYKNNRFLSVGEEFLYSFKVFKLVKLLAMDINEASLKSFRRNNQKAVNSYLEIGVNLVDERRDKEALEYLNKARDLDPANPRIYRNMALVSKDNRETAKLFEKAIALEPMSTVWYTQLVSHCMDKSDPELDNEIIAFLRKYEKVNPDIKDILAMLSNRQKYFNDLSGWLKHDLAQMLALCRKNRINVIIQDYPVKYADDISLKHINSILKEAADESGAIFVGNAAVFDGLPKDNGGEVYFARDDHCNAKGYGLMAKNVFDKLNKTK